MRFKHVDLFAGVGGFREAVRPLGGETVFSSEWDSTAAGCYEANWGDRPAGDIRAIRRGDVPSHHLMTAGFPCQPYSQMGLRRGLADERGLLFFSVLELARWSSTPLLLLENVPTLAGHDGGRTMAAMLRLLELSGYEVSKAVLNSSLYGCRTRRLRIYLACFRDRDAVARFRWPAPTLEPVRLLDVMSSDASVLDSVKSWPLSAFRPAAKEMPCFRLGPIQCGELDVFRRRQERAVYSPDGHAPTCITSRTATVLDGRLGRARMLTGMESLLALGFPPAFRLPPGQAGAGLAGNSIAVPVVRAVVKEMLRAAGF